MSIAKAPCGFSAATRAVADSGFIRAGSPSEVVPHAAPDRNRLPRRRSRGRGDGVHRRAPQALKRDRYHRGSSRRSRGPLAGRVSLRPPSSAIRLLRRELGPAWAGRDRRSRAECGLLRARRRRRAAGLLRARDESPFPAHGARSVFPQLRLRRRAPFHLPGCRRVVASARAPQAGRHDVSRGRHPGDGSASVRGGRRRSLRPCRGDCAHQRPPRALRDHRRGQDGPRRCHVAA